MEKLKDYLPGILAITSLIGFLVILGFSMKGDVGKDNELLSSGFSTLSAILTSVVGYYYGNKSAEATQNTAKSIASTMESMRKAAETAQNKGNG